MGDSRSGYFRPGINTWRIGNPTSEEKKTYTQDELNAAIAANNKWWTEHLDEWLYKWITQTNDKPYWTGGYELKQKGLTFTEFVKQQIKKEATE